MSLANRFISYMESMRMRIYFFVESLVFCVNEVEATRQVFIQVYFRQV